MLAGGAVVRWGRESLSKTLVNRRMITTGVLTFGAQLVLQIGCQLHGLSVTTSLVLMPVLWAATTSTFAATVDKRFWVPVAGFVAAFLLGCKWPEQRWNLLSGSNFIILVTFIIAWWNPTEDAPRVVMRMRKERLARAAAREGGADGTIPPGPNSTS